MYKIILRSNVYWSYLFKTRWKDWNKFVNCSSIGATIYGKYENNSRKDNIKFCLGLKKHILHGFWFKNMIRETGTNPVRKKVSHLGKKMMKSLGW